MQLASSASSADRYQTTPDTPAEPLGPDSLAVGKIIAVFWAAKESWFNAIIADVKCNDTKRPEKIFCYYVDDRGRVAQRRDDLLSLKHLQQTRRRCQHREPRALAIGAIGAIGDYRTTIGPLSDRSLSNASRPCQSHHG